MFKLIEVQISRKQFTVVRNSVQLKFEICSKWILRDYYSPLFTSDLRCFSLVNSSSIEFTICFFFEFHFFSLLISDDCSSPFFHLSFFLEIMQRSNCSLEFSGIFWDFLIRKFPRDETSALKLPYKQIGFHFDSV